jgi:sterol desaturase/sphingolipid hydroxylase (fatty acid hydroxylase superfamily)
METTRKGRPFLISAIFFAAIGGFLVWTFVEYAMHNFNGHKMKGKTAFSREHLKHHAEEGYFASFPSKVLRAFLIIPPVYFVASLGMPSWVALSFTASFLSGHVLYEVVHYRLHFVPPTNAYMRWAARHHFAHHFNCPKNNHGVTTSLWDHVFGTYQQVQEVRVPRRLAMSWLVDENTKEVHLPFQATFRLTGKLRAS